MNLHSRFSILFVVGLSLIAASGVVRADQEYKWTGGAAGYSGTIILDSDSNSAGSIADIISGQVTTPEGTYNFDPTESIGGYTFTWNPSQITYMYFEWITDSGTVEAGFGENYTLNSNPPFFNFVVSEYILSSSPTYQDLTGSWTAASSSVPDACETSVPLGGSLIALAALRRRFAK